MASGKLSPRQKMINLMYLIFIAMIAMQMSKEVLSAFGYMNEKLADNNITAIKKNTTTLANLATKAGEQKEKYEPLYLKAKKVDELSKSFNDYLDTKKSLFLEGQEDVKDYETMDKVDNVNEHFFVGDGFTAEGQEFLDNVNGYKAAIIEIIGENSPLALTIQNRFDTSDQKTEDGKQPWLNNRYEGFPLISTITNLTSMQTDISTTQSEIFGNLLGGQLESDVSMTKYEAIVIPEKTAFFQGENFKGKIVLGKVDDKLKPTRVEVNGREISGENLQAGQVLLDFPAGSVGERDIKGVFIFTEKGIEIPIEINSSYAVIPKPNSAVISADKMNVVYRGVPNPMTISIPGIPDNLVTANGVGLKRATGSGKYIMTPGSGKEVKISVSGKLPNGQTVSTSQNFRIKGIPAPSGSIRKQIGYVIMPKTSLGNSTVGAVLPDFDFDLVLRTSGFTVKVPGQGAVVVNGNKMNAQAKKAIAKAKRGDVVTIFAIKSSLVGNTTYKIKEASAVSIEIQ
tara:strand:+ start:16817 stop:18352 length:1536 start_codon:yes stop_codon:yes gene_type:complete